MGTGKFFNEKKVYCPICGTWFNESDYLRKVIPDEKVLWFANTITHYRHTHITSWNKCWGHNGYRYRNKWFGDYDDEKRKVNERAKRQIIRKAKSFMNSNNISSEHIMALQYNDQKTIDLAKKHLDNKAH